MIADLVADETGYVKKYMKQNNIEKGRAMFRHRTKMLELKENMKGRYGRDNLGCEEILVKQMYISRSIAITYILFTNTTGLLL